MDSSGRIYELPVDREEMRTRWLKHLSPINRQLTDAERASGRIGFNAPCVCGSGRKFKRCCYGKSTEHRRLMVAKAPLESA